MLSHCDVRAFCGALLLLYLFCTPVLWPVAWNPRFAQNSQSLGGVRDDTIRALPHLLHFQPPTLSVTAITPARENYHCRIPPEAENRQRHYAFYVLPTEVVPMSVMTPPG